MKQTRLFRRRTFWIVLLVAALVIVCFSATGVFASLGDTTSVVTVRPGTVGCAVDPDYSVRNTGTVPALIRAKVVVNWLDEEGNTMANPPAEAVLEIGKPAGWQQLPAYGEIDEGYWYYGGVLEPGEKAGFLGLVSSAGGNVRVTVLAEALQAAPQQAAAEAWDLSYSNGGWHIK